MKTEIKYNAETFSDAVKFPLSKKQNAIIFCLQKGCCLVTGQEFTGAWVAGNKGQFHFSGILFWRLFNMGLIKQSTWESNRFDYVLTDLGKRVITSPFDMEQLMEVTTNKKAAPK